MTIEDAARLAADRELAEGSDGWDCTRDDLYVRAFRQGYQKLAVPVTEIVERWRQEAAEMDDGSGVTACAATAWRIRYQARELEALLIEARVGTADKDTGTPATRDNA